VLVDGGPPGDGIAAKLRAAGADRLGAAIVTHDQSDHAGGIDELLGDLPVDRLLLGAPSARLLAEARAAGAATGRLARGDSLRSGQLRLDVLWPPAELLGDTRGEDPNHLALVMLAHWRRFSMLLTADAEAESTPLDPGPIDVLKVAHHGSDDAGLGALLDRARPRLAVISVGAGNPFGHPTAATLATLAAHGVRTLRTDRDGDIAIEVGPDSIQVGGEG
jgi:competence protein ComEC